MLKQLILENWKSFRYAELPLDPLTVVIGTNASGKSNMVEALEFLQRIGRGENIEAALAGDKTLSSIRGGVEWAALKPETKFTLNVLVNGKYTKADYLYTITVETKPHTQLLDESLTLIKHSLNKNEEPYLEKLFQTDNPSFNTPSITVHLYDTNIIKSQEFRRNRSILSQLIGLSMKMVEAINVVSQSLENIFILESIPSKIQDYSPLSDRLESDGSNIAGVLAALNEERKDEVELALSHYIKYLPERDIQKVWAESVGRLKTDAMLYCEEEWNGEMTVIDAKIMSDGTLSFLAILTALLTQPEGSQLVIEEIDNRLHPSRAELLVRILREIGSKRKIDILLTTHNPALLDALGPEIVPFVVVAHRDKQTGESKLTLLEDIDNFSKLFASYSLGDMTTKGAIERSLSRNE